MSITFKACGSSRNILRHFDLVRSRNVQTEASNGERHRLKSDVISLYKNLIYLSQDWPTDLRPQIKSAFIKNREVNDVEEIRKLIARGEYVCKEIIATYHLRKYRTMKRRYYNEEDNAHLQELFKSFTTQ